MITILKNVRFHFSFIHCFGLILLCAATGCMHSTSTAGSVAAPPGFLATPLAANNGNYGAMHVDTNLQDAWGLSVNSSTFWIADRASGRVSYYDSTGAFRSAFPVADGSPTGIVSTDSFATGFTVPTYGKAAYVIASLNGSLSALPGFYSSAVIVDSEHAASSSFTGLAVVSVNGTPRLFAPNVKNGSLDEFDASFNRVNQASGQYPGYTPFNAVAIDSNLFVTEAKTNGSFVATGGGNGGYIDLYDFNGNFIRMFSSNTVLDEPWGVAIAPANFGAYSGKLLVGNFGDGKINVFDPTTGAYLGTLNNPAGAPLVIAGLWSLVTENGILYYTSGPNNGADGVFGTIAIQ